MTDLVLTGGLVDVGAGEFRRADVAISAGRIEAVGTVDAADAARVDCSRSLVVPGLVNAHCHSNENWFRGMWDNLPLEPWMLFSYPVLAAPPQNAREIYVRTLLGGIELVRSGATCVVDFLYELPAFSDESLAAVVGAYRDLGLRALVVLGMADRAFHETVVLDQGLVSRELVDALEGERPPGWPEWEGLARSAVDRFHRPDEGIAIGLGPSGPQRCSDELLAGCAALADELDLQVHIHVLETRMQALSGRRMYGSTLPEHLAEVGFLGPRVSFEHGIWLTDRDIEIVRDAGVTVVHNPVSNLKLGSGICPVPRLLEEDVPLALGTDGASSNDGNDMYAALKLAALLHKVWELDYERWPGAREAWSMATAGGARAAGDETLGRIEPGSRADLVLLDAESFLFTPLNHPLRQLVLGSATQAVDSALIGGRWVVRNGEIVTLDERSILAEGRELGREVVGRHNDAFDTGRRLLAAVRAGWLEAFGADVGVGRTPRL